MATARRHTRRAPGRPTVSDRDPFYRFCQWVPRTLWRAVAGLRVEGLDHIPREGPFLLVANHESNLDPILLQASCPRIVASMAKSTQFTVPALGRLVQRLYAFPVRRYQVDPQSVRTSLRLLAAGRPVVIYLEGERTWDGRMQPPRPGTLRLVLKAGVPVVPCAISGAYDAWPRWAKVPQFRSVTIRFGPPLFFPQLDGRDDREAALPETGLRLTAGIKRLRGEGEHQSS